MTQKMRTVGAAMCVAALTALLVTHASAQTGNIDRDLVRAQEILNQLAVGSLSQDSRMPLEEELARIEAHEYVVPVKLEARKYTAGSGYYPVTVSKPGLLEPPVLGRLEMPKGTARRAKSQLNPAYATVRVGAIAGVPPRAVKAVVSLYARVDDRPWYVSTDDVRLNALTGPSAGSEPAGSEPAESAVFVDDAGESGVSPTDRRRDDVASGSTSFLSWQRLNTVGNRYGCMAVLPNGSVLAGTDGAGVMRSHDHGVTWTPSRDGLPYGAYISRLAVGGGAVFAGTWRPPNVAINHDEGVYRSVDGGLSWTHASDGLPVDRQVAAFAWDGVRVYVSLAQGLYRSDDGGGSWNSCDRGLPINARVSALASLGSALLAGVWDVGVHRSDDGGDSWTLISGSPVFSMRFATDGVGVHVANWEGHGVSRSPDGGTTWKTDTRGLTHGFIRDIVEHRGVLYAASSEGGRGVFVSYDGGESWAPAVDGLLPPFQVTSRSMTVDSLAVSDPYIYAGTAGGVFRARLPLTEDIVATMPNGDAAAAAVEVPDANLERRLREALRRPEGDLTPALLASLDEFQAGRLGIEDVTGLEFAVNLRTLDLSHNQAIGDVGPLAGLTRLEHLGFPHNRVKDLGPLAELTALKGLTLDGNPIGSSEPWSASRPWAGYMRTARS